MACFAAGPITESLEELTIRQTNLSPSELAHLHSLRHLRTLHLYQYRSLRLDDAILATLVPPTPLLPSLTALFDHFRDARGFWDFRQHLGPSLHWMHERRAQ